MTRFMIFPYTQNSASAIMLAAELDGQRILREGSRFKPREDDLIINWGASDCPYEHALNRQNDSVLNKLSFFNRLVGKSLTPPFAASIQSAQSLTFPVFCRTLIKDRDGEGIVIAETAANLVPAPLYTSAINKTSEFRIHIGRLPNQKDAEIIGVQRKYKMESFNGDGRIWAGEHTKLVWTVDGEVIKPPKEVLRVVHEAFACFPELTFAAFDVAFDSTNRGAYCLEANSAPMLTARATGCYAEFFQKYAELRGSVQAPPLPPPTPHHNPAAPAAGIMAEPIPNEAIVLTVTVQPGTVMPEQLKQMITLVNGVVSVE